MKLTTYVSVYLVLEKNGKFLLSKRKNTGYRDGWRSMVAGHLEEGEKAIDAMIRETREEANIQINREDLKVAHVMFRHEDRAYADIFLTCKKYSGELRNNEPNVCDGLEFFSLEEFPENTVEYVKTAIDYIKKGVAFSDDTL